MSLDRRLREELRHEADAIEPDVERQLGAVEAGARRRNGIGASWLLLAAAIVIAAIILRIPNGQDTGPAGRGPSVAPSPGVSASPPTLAAYPQIAGTYAATLDPANAIVKADGVGGSWTMRLDPTGAVVLSPPSSYLPGANGLLGTGFSLDGDRFRTDLFYGDCYHSVGKYVWNLAAGRLSFTSVDDNCSIRKTLLTSTPWVLGK